MRRTSRIAMLLTLFACTAGMTGAADPATGAGAGAALAKPSGPAWTDRMTDDQLRELQQKPSVLVGTTTGTPARKKQLSFAETSDFISFNGLSTFVPKGAILHVPGQLRERVADTPHGQLVLWRDFLRRYPAVVAPLEVTIDQAAGGKLIEPRMLDAAARSERVIVAVIRGNPTSVARPVPSPEEGNP